VLTVKLLGIFRIYSMKNKNIREETRMSTKRRIKAVAGLFRLLLPKTRAQKLEY
jgi:hypothetical protein